MRRRRKILVVFLVVAALLAGAVVVLYMVVLPRVVRSEIQAALRGVGVRQSAFDLREVSWRATRVYGITLGDPAWLTADSVETDYSVSNLWDRRVGAMTITNAVWNVQVTDGVIDWGPVFPASATPSMIDLPVDRLELRRCVVNIDREGELVSLPLDGSITRQAPGDYAVSLKTVIAGEPVVLNAAVVDHISTLTVKAEAATTSVPPDSLKASVQWARTPASRPHHVEVEFLRHALQMSLDSERLAVAGIGGDASVKLGEDLVPVEYEGRITCGSADLAGHFARDIALSLSSGNATLRIGELSIDAAERLTADDVSLTATGPASTPLVVFRRQTAEGGFQADIHGGIRLASPVSFMGETMRAAITNFELETAGTIGEAGSFSADAQVDLGECVVPPFTANSGTIVAGLSGTDAIEVRLAAIDLGPHGRFRADPFRFAFHAPVIAADVACENLDLSIWLPLLSQSEVNGDGVVHGRVEVAFEPGNRGQPISFGRGYLMADPPTGWVQVSNPKIIEGLLEGYEFESADLGGALTDLKARIISTLQDFSFDDLHMDFAPVDREDALQIQVSGKGRQGAEPIPIGSLTVNVNDFDRVFNDAIGLKSGYDRLTE